MTTTITTPERSLEQRMAALHVANEIRSRRAALKRDLKAGGVDLVQLLLDPPAWLETAKVMELLLAVPRYGRVKTLKTLRRASITTTTKTVGGLSDRQRHELVDALQPQSSRARADR